MGRAARQYVLETHDLNKNYGRVEDRLIGIVNRPGRRPATGMVEETETG
jgi:hypothetical protein